MGRMADYFIVMIDMGRRIVEEAREKVDRDVSLPPGYFVRFGGQFENLVRARRRLVLVVPVALALILSPPYVTYGRRRDALRVFTAPPFALPASAAKSVLSASPAMTSRRSG